MSLVAYLDKNCMIKADQMKKKKDDQSYQYTILVSKIALLTQFNKNTLRSW